MTRAFLAAGMSGGLIAGGFPSIYRRAMSGLLLCGLSRPTVNRIATGVPARRGPQARPHTHARAADVLGYFAGPAPATDPPKRSTDGSSPAEAQRSASATSRTMSRDHCSKPEDSDPAYTLECDEPVKTAGGRRRDQSRRTSTGRIDDPLRVPGVEGKGRRSLPAAAIAGTAR